MAGRPRKHFWGWSQPVRVVLTVGLLWGTLALAWTSWKEKRPSVNPALVVEVNIDPPEVLVALPRIGPALVARIVVARRERPFRSLEDFDVRVRGVGPVTVKALRPFLRFSVPKTALR